MALSHHGTCPRELHGVGFTSFKRKGENVAPGISPPSVKRISPSKRNSTIKALLAIKIRDLLYRPMNTISYATNNEPFTEYPSFSLGLETDMSFNSVCLLVLFFSPAFITDEAVTDSFQLQKLLWT